MYSKHEFLCLNLCRAWNWEAVNWVQTMRRLSLDRERALLEKQQDQAVALSYESSVCHTVCFLKYISNVLKENKICSFADVKPSPLAHFVPDRHNYLNQMI